MKKILVSLNGVVTEVDATEELERYYLDHPWVRFEPVLPVGDWVEVTSIGSDMREFASAELVWAGEERE